MLAATTLHLTRDSVAAGDDSEAPHPRRQPLGGAIATPDDLQHLLADVARDYLPSVAGRASWAAWSRFPLALFSNLWSAPKTIWMTEGDLDRLDRRGDVLHVHFVYLAMVDPDLALEVLRRSTSAFR